MYQALYRKWRPQSFADVVGQSAVTETLAKQIETNHTSHAYLFTGSRGTGKTTCAKILAKAVNCENPFHGNPCNKCPTCLGIQSGEILDVVEIDAASNNGVDSVRELRDEAIYSPANARKRVYIIDEVHMFSTGAFNALLKIMEEPPEHVVFILATTELHKVPATIASRCQRFIFKRIPPSEIAERLIFIAKNEGATVSDSAARYIASLSDGAMRDALSLLDQCISVGEGKVDDETVENVVGLAGKEQTFNMANAIAEKNLGVALTCLNDIYASGRNLTSVLSELADLFRDILIIKTTGGEKLPRISARYTDEEIRPISGKLDNIRICTIIDEIQKTTSAIASSSNKRIDAELCCVRMCVSADGEDTAALIERVAELERKLKGGYVTVAGNAPVNAEKTAVRAEKKNESPKETAAMPVEEDVPPMLSDEDAPPAEETEAPKATHQKEPVTASSAVSGDAASIWQRIFAAAKPRLSPGVEALFRGLSASLSDNVLSITSANPFVMQMLSRTENMDILRAAANEQAPGIVITASKEQKKAVVETSGMDELLSGLDGISGIVVK